MCYPDLGVDLVTRLQMLPDVILLLCDPSKLLAAVDADAANRLAQERRAKRGISERCAYVLTLSNLLPIVVQSRGADDIPNLL